MIGVPMKMKEDIGVREIIEREIEIEFISDREELLEAANRANSGQDENRKSYNKKRKYKVGDLVAIARTQFGTGKKHRPKCFGPYEEKRPL